MERLKLIWVLLVVAAIVNVANAALIHQWKLDEMSLAWNGSVWAGVQDSVTGDTAGELWGYTATSDLTAVIGQPGIAAGDSAYNFTELSGVSCVSTKNSTVVPATGDFTILVWMNTTSLHTVQGHLFSNNNAQAGRSNLYLQNGALMWFHNGGISLSETNSPIFDGNWHLVGIGRQGDRFDLLRDGQVVASGNSTGAISQAQWWTIGRARSYGNEFDGMIADVRVYDNYIPEPTTLLLLAAGVIGVRRTRKA